MNTNKEFIEKQRAVLLKEKERLAQEIESIQRYPDKSSVGDDVLQEMSDFEHNISLEDELHEMMKKIDRALLSIENGTYGSCAICRQQIEHGRLGIMPSADICATCAGKK
ncbi:MAG: TraR/DksA C4-type zinc finger protein [Candidatus Berkelbacteria bacterium]